MKTIRAKNKNTKNKNIGIRTAFWEATGKKAKTLKEAKKYFGVTDK